MKPTHPTAALERLRAALADLMGDARLTDRRRLRCLEEIDAEIAGMILDLESRLFPAGRERFDPGDPPRI